MDRIPAGAFDTGGHAPGRPDGHADEESRATALLLLRRAATQRLEPAPPKGADDGSATL
jgi:hypothetical protein